MYRIIVVIIYLGWAQTAFSQNTQLEIFDGLTNRTWKAEGTWGDGSKFKQEIYFGYDLDSTVVIARSKGYTNNEQTAYGDRNLGIRKYDEESKSIKFWEFDVFGGLTKGEVIAIDKNILYQYNYGESKVTDMWEFVNDSTYNFKVGIHDNGKWKQIYLETQFISEPNRISLQFYREKLIGSWKSKAWDGVLEETWKLDGNNHLIQNVQYKVNGEVQYEATTKMEEVNGEIILFSIIKDSNPKIFKATSFSEDRIVFENSEYKNPNKVVYIFAGDGTYHRKISGIENNQPSEYEFKFSLVDAP